MAGDLSALLRDASASLWTAAEALAWPALLFAALAVLVKGRAALTAARRAAAEMRINLALYFLDALFVFPVIVLLINAIDAGVERYGLALLGAEDWGRAGAGATLLAVLFLGDFVGYWRHRLEHTQWLWPAHAVHHSDRQMTWLTLSRFHPVNRLVTAGVDTACLALLGFPDWALVANNLVRHWYGCLIHADLPWTYGRLGALFVSPAMHRWHHVREVSGSGSNFATLFALFDRAFGTCHMPGTCDAPLGVAEDMGRGAFGQILHPFRVWGRRLAGRRIA